MFMTPFAGRLSGSFGRKRIHMLRAVLTGVYGFACAVISLVSTAMLGDYTTL